MKKVVLASMFVGLSSMATALPLCSPASDVTSFTAGGGCTVGNLQFSNFVYTAVSGPGEGPTALTSFSNIGGNVLLNLQPNQGNGTLAQNSILTFTVTGLDASVLIIGTSSSNGGNGSTSVHQVVCAGAIDGSGNCTPGPALQNITNAGGTATPTSLFAPQTTVNVWRNVLTPAGTAVTASTFDVQSTPEPVALALVGSGLIGLALFRKRRKN